MVDLDPIPLADEERLQRLAGPSLRPWGDRHGRGRGACDRAADRDGLCWHPLAHSSGIAHGLAIWRGMGGLEGLTNGWPLWRDDHPLYYHSALVTRAFLHQSATTAGYDPAFMAGYAKSVVFPASSTLPELVVWAFGGDRPELAYKLYVLVSAVALPGWWLSRLQPGGFEPRSGAGGLAVSSLRLDRFPDQLRGFRHAALPAGHPAGTACHRAFRRLLDPGWNPQMADGHEPDEPHRPGSPDHRDGRGTRGGSRLSGGLDREWRREPRGARSGCGSGRRAHRRGSGHPPALLRRAAYRCLADSAHRAGE